MRNPARSGPKLPRELLQRLDQADGDSRSSGGARLQPSTRKLKRKAARVEKRTQQSQGGRRRALQSRDGSWKDRATGPLAESSDDTSSDNAYVDPATNITTIKKPKPLSQQSLKPSKSENESSKLSSADEGLHQLLERPRISHTVARKLAEDDSEIQALERALGIKNGKQLSKSFEQDGLSELLGDIGSSDGELERQKGKREEDDWLQAKRKKARLALEKSTVDGKSLNEAFDESNENSDVAGCVFDENLSSSAESEGFSGFEDEIKTSIVSKKPRENPYLPPQLPNSGPGAKYVPPSLRLKDSGDNENLRRLERQIKGALNRLSEANLLGIVGEVQAFCRQNPRQHVSSKLLDALYELICDAAPLQDTFMILHAAFVAALHRTLGSEFTARAIERLVEEFESRESVVKKGGTAGKELSNLVTFLAELYNFRVIGSSLIYDYIRRFISAFSEEHTELLLKIARLSGTQLRQDDPSSLKDIVALIQGAVAGIGSDNLSVRTRFMIETIENLKNNRTKTGVANSSINSEHTARMRKTLGSMNQGSIKTSEPLRVTLNDLQNSDKRGKWWITDAGYRDKDEIGSRINSKDSNKPKARSEDDTGLDAVQELLQLAKEQKMNTDVRRSIFVTILSSNDYKDATERLLKLPLNKSQQLEIPQVLLHCAGAEKAYNPFYTFISKQLCSSHRMQKAFQFCLWNIFKQTEEDDESLDDETVAEPMSMRTLVNVGKMYGNLIAVGGLNLSLLKNLEFAYLRPKTGTLVEILLVTIFQDIRHNTNKSDYGDRVRNTFMVCKDAPSITAGLRLFLKKRLRRADILKGSRQQGTVKEGCKYATETLKALSGRATTKGGGSAATDDSARYPYPNIDLGE